MPKGDVLTHISTKQAPKARKSKKANTNVEKDFFNLDFDEFYLKYEKVFEIVTQSKIFYKNGYALLDEKYKEIKRFDKLGIITERRKKGVGEDRKKALYNWLMKKKQIKPDITKDELLFNAVFEICRFIDNRDGKLNKAYIMEVVSNVFESECTMVEEPNHRQFKVDKVYCSKNGISANQYKNVVRKKLHFEEIGGWYDISVSVGKNLQFAKENNIKVSQKTLYRFCNENGINPKGEGTKEETNNNISMKEEGPTNKAEISAQKSDIKQGGTTHQTQQETPLKRNYETIKWVNADEYREHCKLYQLFAERNQKIMSYQIAI